jgi:hypothetical protein
VENNLGWMSECRLGRFFADEDLVGGTAGGSYDLVEGWIYRRRFRPAQVSHPRSGAMLVVGNRGWG